MTKKKAYLTIDDSPSIYMKDKVDFLSKNNIPALFFCQGNFIQQNPGIVLYAIKKGFVIGNHSYSHPKFDKISVEKCLFEISETDTILNELYRKANKPNYKKYFRYPHGIKGNITHSSPKILIKYTDSKFRKIEKHLNKLNYVPLRVNNPKVRFPEILRLRDTDSYWTFDIGEWKLAKNAIIKISDIMDNIDKKLSYMKGNEIFLMHDHVHSHQFFEQIIVKLLSKGFQFNKIP